MEVADAYMMIRSAMKTIDRSWILSPLVRLVLVAIMLLCTAVVADACPSCGADMAKQKGGAELVQGFTYSMVGMASMPFLLFGSVAFYLFRAYRKKQEEEFQDDPGSRE